MYTICNVLLYTTAYKVIKSRYRQGLKILTLLFVTVYTIMLYHPITITKSDNWYQTKAVQAVKTSYPDLVHDTGKM